MTMLMSTPTSTPVTEPGTEPRTRPVAKPCEKPRPGAPDRGKRMVDLAAGDCRFPLGPSGGRARRFCGRPARPGGAYCDAHHAVAYLAPPDADATDGGAEGATKGAAENAADREAGE